MWALMEGGGAVNVSKIDLINVTSNGGKYRLQFRIAGNSYTLKGTWSNEQDAFNALVAVTGAVDAAN